MVIRIKTIRNLVMGRDLGLCRCCGFKASEVHHITPLVYGGLDEPKNMISLCGFCHKHAPNTKEEFKDYFKRNGARYEMLLGSFVNKCMVDDIDLSKALIHFKKIVNILRQFDIKNATEEYNLKEWTLNKLEDIDLE